jgi:PAP2 superfamily
MALSLNPIPRTHPSARRVADAFGNLAMMGVMWILYRTVRQLSADDWGDAFVHAGRVINLQKALGLPSEAMIQQWIIDSHAIVKFFNVFYVGVHFPLTVAMLLWALLRHRPQYTRIRNTIMSVSIVGLILHVAFPLAPPRMLRGFVDTAKVFGPDPYKSSIGSAANQIAAMPSLHVGWALIVALAAISVLRSRWRYLWLLHPAVTMTVVIATANHYWLDGFVAIALTVCAWAVFRPRREWVA